MPGSSPLKPITPERLAREITKLAAERKDGTLTPEVYDQRFARMIGELRDRGIDGNREQLMAVLTPLKENGTVSAEEWQHLAARLGLDA